MSDLSAFYHNSPTNSPPHQGILFKPPVFGAYSELFAALSPSITAQHNGGFVVPWGRFGDIPAHIEKGLKPQADGGSGAAEKFWCWCERETECYF
jgi:retinol dehydrogenase 12